METKNDAKLLEPRWSQPSRRQSDLIGRQVHHNLLDSLCIFWELLIVCLVSLHNLFCSFVNKRSPRQAMSTHHKCERKQGLARQLAGADHQ